VSVPPEAVPIALDGLTFAALEARLRADGVRPVHAAALWNAIYRSAGPGVSREGLPPPLDRWLEHRLGSGLELLEPRVTVRTASDDGRTEKFLLRLADGQDIETVIMGYPGRFTACISTQAGCAMGCVFCATGQMGFARHLLPHEIVMQVNHVRRVLCARGDRLRNLVLMGMGEPLHNYDGVMQALDIISDSRGLAIAPSRITVNTVGVVPGILRLAQERPSYHLGVSLHGSTEEERAALVPVNQRWPLADLLAACRTYCDVTGRRIFFAWTLIGGVNDTPAHAARLATLLGGIDAHVNLIRLNSTAGYAGHESAESAAVTFRAVVQAAGIPCTIRQRRGIDVAAGCGQLTAERQRRDRKTISAP
jgi:23S rRNA (adenine2503-C2)-methyltransferase